MAFHKTAGSKFYIGPAVNIDSLNGLSDQQLLVFYEGLSASWVEVEEIEDLGEHGDSAEEVAFTSIGDRRVRRVKGAKNAGTKNIVVGRDPLDEGQAAMAAAEGTDFNYAFKVVHADARSPSHTNSEEYFAGLVMGKSTQQGTVNTVTRRTFPVAINTEILEVLSAETSTS